MRTIKQIQKDLEKSYKKGDRAEQKKLCKELAEVQSVNLSSKK